MKPFFQAQGLARKEAEQQGVLISLYTATSYRFCQNHKSDVPSIWKTQIFRIFFPIPEGAQGVSDFLSGKATPER